VEEKLGPSTVEFLVETGLWTNGST
jgi:hypothetical protein